MAATSLPPSLSLAGKTALVTGGSRGIGRHISLELSRRGASVALVYSSDSVAAASTVAEIEALGSKAIAIKADLRDSAAYPAIVEKVVAEWGAGVGILVHNAATTDGGATTATLTQDIFSKVMDINVRAPVFLTQAALPHMSAGGRIILISSTSARLATVGSSMPAYAASKAAVEGLVRSWAYEFGPMGITVNAVAPGLTETDFAKSMPVDVMDGIRESYAKVTPFGRTGQPDDVAQVVAFLASEGARWVTGSTVSASGGRVLY